MAMTLSAASCCVPGCSALSVSFSQRRQNGPSPRRLSLAPVLGNSSRNFHSRNSGQIQSRRITSKRAFATIGVRAATLTEEEDVATKTDDVTALKVALLSAVAGLDRGLVATKADENIANSIAVNLESKGGGVSLPKDLDKLQGKWRLAFSSGFNTGSFGGQRPGPRITRLPLVSIGLVYQRIDVLNREFDNIVDLNLPTPWPLPPIQLTATLAHNFEVVGSATIKIIFEKTIIKFVGDFLSSIPPFELSQFQLPEFLRPPRDPRSGEFTSTYIDDDFRITRGDRGELRIFVRA